ncbi:hypothetical protein [Thermococcus atlanticus]
MTRRGRPPVMKPWLLTINKNRRFVIFAKTEEEAREKARFIVKQSFPFSRFSVRRYYGRVGG